MLRHTLLELGARLEDGRNRFPGALAVEVVLMLTCALPGAYTENHSV